MARLFIPLFFGLHDLYPWARPAEVASNDTLQRRGLYMSAWSFGARTVFFFGAWLLIARYLRKWSLEQDQTADAGPTRKLRALSGPAIVIVVLTGTFAYVDWIMSTEREWYSTMFAVIVLIGQILTAFAFGIILLALGKREASLAAVVTRVHYHHLGNLLLTFVLFWTYVAFGQLLIVYSGNLPREIEWYLHRIAGSWIWVVGLLGLFHFFLPFFLLLFRPMKRHIPPLTIIACLVFAAHIADVYWMVVPSFYSHGIHVHWMDLTSFIGVGSLWIGGFLGGVKSAPLLPQNDPGQQFAFSYARAH